MAQPFLNIAIRAAREAGDLIIRETNHRHKLQVKRKEDQQWVTQVDCLAEALIIEIIQDAYPHHTILTEESGHLEALTTQANTPDYLWIIDPLDGTVNYIHDFPHFSVSIALKYKDFLVAGVIYDPLRQDLFTAVRGEGAQKNNVRLRVSKKARLSDALIGSNMPYRSFLNSLNHTENYWNCLKTLALKCEGLRRSGSAALDLAYVAAGSLDALWYVNLSPWDMAAGLLIVQEAGGLTADFHQACAVDVLKNSDIIAGNPRIFKQLLQEIRPVLINNN